MNDERDASSAALIARISEFVLRVLRMFSALPKSTVAQVLGKQVLRSGTSVGANFREAQLARGKAEFLSKIGDSLKELDETAYWLELLVESRTVPPVRLRPLRDECDQLLAILTAISKTTKKRLNQNSRPMLQPIHNS